MAASVAPVTAVVAAAATAATAAATDSATAATAAAVVQAALHPAAGTTTSGNCATPAGWVPLSGVTPEELTLDHCLPTGQSFRWQQLGPGRYIGVIGQRLVRMRQGLQGCEYQVVARGPQAAAQDDEDAIREYFNLPRGSSGQEEGVRLTQLSQAWAAACTRYAHIQPHLPGARMLRQDPVECLFQFICSQNNHISRIHGMVHRLCETYGTPLIPLTPLSLDDEPGPCAPAQGLSPAPAAEAAAAAAGTAARKRRRSSSSSRAASSPVAAAAVDATLQPVGSLSGQGSQGFSGDANGDASTDAPSNSQGPAQARQGLSQQEVRVAAGPPLGDGTPPPAAGGGEVNATPNRPRRKRTSASAAAAPAAGGGAQAASGGLQHSTFYAFPSLEQLSKATEEELRAAGFGYRAKFIVGAVQQLQQQPGGGAAWLLALRQATFQEAAQRLAELPGVGPKVAACVCLFSLDKHDAIPVDTHVWQIATKYYLPGLKGKSLTKKVHEEVQAAFVTRFGPYAGWAHNAMFIAELAAHKHRIPPH